MTLLAAATLSCTHNNGDIGVWFGLWKVTSVEVDGSADRKYKGNMYFSFQNTPVLRLSRASASPMGSVFRPRSSPVAALM